MGSISDYIDCPKCGNEAHNEFYYKSGEEYITCTHCGYSRKFYITNYEDQPTEPGKEGEFEWVPKFELEELEPHGAYRLRQKGAMAYECGSFTEPAGAEEFARLVEERKGELEYAEYTTFIDNKVERVIIIENEEDEQLN
jgi:hypothetical protein